MPADRSEADEEAQRSLPEGWTAESLAAAPTGPYGTHTFDLDAQANWVNTGLFLRAGETAELSATGEWTIDGEAFGPEGDPASERERGCQRGTFAARSGLRFEDELSRVGAGGTFTATSDDSLHVDMIFSTDLGETYAARLRLGGTIAAASLATLDDIAELKERLGDAAVSPRVA